MVKLNIKNLFDTALVLISYQHGKRKNNIKRRGRYFWSQPSFADGVISSSYQSFVLK